MALKTGTYYLDQLSRIDRDQEAIAVINERLGATKIGDFGPDHLALIAQRAWINIDAQRFELASSDANIINEVTIRLYGRLNLKYVQSLNILEAIEDSKGNKKLALTLMLECRDLLKKIYPEKYPVHAIVANNLADLEVELGLFREAELHAKLAITIGTAALGKESQSILTFKSNLARAYTGLGNYEDAIKLHNHVLREREKRSNGELTPQIIRSNLWLALAFMESGMKASALSTLNNTLVRMNSTPDGPDTIRLRKEFMELIKKLSN
jgi:tetratricopeptide (TPR) repeat protein